MACFDQSTLLVYPLQLSEQNLLKFGSDATKITNLHDFPVGRTRISKTQARYMISCGEDQDLYFKLWNLQTLTCDHKFKSGFLKHKLMAQSQKLDVYAVAGGTSEVRLFKIEQHIKAATLNLNKIMTITSHKNQVIDIAFSGDLCATIGHDGMLFVNKIDLS